MNGLIRVTVISLAVAAFVPATPGRTAGPEPADKLLDAWLHYHQPREDLEAGAAVLNYPWSITTSSPVRPIRTIAPATDAPPWQALVPASDAPRCHLWVTLESPRREDAGAGVAVVGATLFADEDAAVETWARLATRLDCDDLVPEIPGDASALVLPVRAAPAFLPGKGGVDELQELICGRQGRWLVVAAIEPDCPFDVDPGELAARAARLLRDGPFTIRGLYVSLSPEQPRRGENLKVVTSLGTFGRPLPGVEVRHHVVLRQGGEIVASIERPETTAALRDGTSLLFQNYLFRVPEDASPGRYALELVVEVDGVPIQQSVEFDL